MYRVVCALIDPHDEGGKIGAVVDTWQMIRDERAEHVTAVCDFYRGSNLLIGARNRIAGVRLTATDADWRYGDGPEATGPIVAILLAMTGRKVALDDLTGDGVAVLRAR
jgi:hypothetical protein